MIKENLSSYRLKYLHKT